jgi:bifunctional DNA-binding transcriptional regulator/antitoxin component of YhaV-PrlF toxin-antitoxin module
MKATESYAVSTILAAVVIPKEIRRTMRIREGDRWRSTPTRMAAFIFLKNTP